MPENARRTESGFDSWKKTATPLVASAPAQLLIAPGECHLRV